MRRTSEKSVRIMLLHLEHLASCRIKTFAHVGHIRRLTPMRSSRLVTNLDDALQKLRDIRTARLSASQRRIRSWRFVSRCVSSWCVSFLSQFSLLDIVSSSGSLDTETSSSCGRYWCAMNAESVDFSETSFGTLCWSCSFTCRLAHSW